MKRLILLLILLIMLLGIGILPLLKHPQIEDKTPIPFSGDSAYQFLLDQLSYGPRTPGSLAHQLTRSYISLTLTDFGWSVEEPSDVFEGHEIYNIIARRGKNGPITIIGAHYDSRLNATEETDAQLRELPVPGANDGASGVAVLLELARTLPEDLPGQTWLVFFDAEDQGHLEGWNWILGSQVFVSNLTVKPDRVVILDMIGDADLNVYRENGSDQTLSNQIWQAAAELGYSKVFINEIKYSILDDHIPFLESGIPAVDVIDFDYAWWHTRADTADKVSKDSLEIVGRTITYWLESNP